MSRIKKLEPMVKEALETRPITRKDDFRLVLEVYKHYIPLNMPIAEVCIAHKKYGLPSFASIIRVRRKIQCTDPSLCDAEAMEVRADAETDFRNYARED